MTFEFDAESDTWELTVNVSHDFKGLDSDEIEATAYCELTDRGHAPFVESVTGSVSAAGGPKGGFTHTAEIEFGEDFDGSEQTIEQIGKHVREAIATALINTP